MGKGSRKWSKKNKNKRQNATPRSQKTLSPSETTTDISSGKPIADVIDGVPAILMPGTPEYQTSFEKIYGKPGLPEGLKPVVNLLGQKMKEKDMAARVGELAENNVQPEQKVVLFRDTVVNFPELYLKVWVTGPPEDTRGCPQLFARAFCSRARSLEDADVVVFTGGPDVDPALYGEEPHPSCYVDEERDYQDIAAYMTCLQLGIPMTGICRGAQFGAMMNGAKLWQDVNNHHGDHRMWDIKRQEHIDKVSSVHHQSVMAGADGMEIVGVCHESSWKWKNPHDKFTMKSMDIEAFFFKKTCFFGVQGHPEYRRYPQFSKWYLNQIYEYVMLNPDVEWIDGRRRLKPDIVAEYTGPVFNEVPRPTLTMISSN